MRKNPPGDRDQGRLCPGVRGPAAPRTVLVAPRGSDGRPDARRVVVAIEQRETLDVLNPIFRDPPRRTRSSGGPTGSRVPWPSSPTPEGGRGNTTAPASSCRRAKYQGTWGRRHHNRAGTYARALVDGLTLW